MHDDFGGGRGRHHRHKHKPAPQLDDMGFDDSDLDGLTLDGEPLEDPDEELTAAEEAGDTVADSIYGFSGEVSDRGVGDFGPKPLTVSPRRLLPTRFGAFGSKMRG